MQYAVMGKTGLRVSRLCLGCMSFGGPDSKDFEWTLGYDASKKVIDRAIDLGVNFFDTADVYSHGRSEEIVGKALEGRRGDVVLATKVGLPTGEGPAEQGLGADHIRRSLSDSLEHLRTDRIDLYQIHRWDYRTPIEDVLETLTQAVRRDNAVAHLGASSMWAWQFSKALHTSERLGLERFATMQNHYNLAYREEEREMIPLCRDEGIAINPWSPLARGFLTGKYRRGVAPVGLRYEKDRLIGSRYFKPEDFDVLESLEDMAAEKGVTPSQLAVAWLLDKPEVTSPVVGVTTVGQLEELVAATEVALSSDDRRRLEEPYKAHPTLGHK